jgi:hypothetical protein
MEAAGVIEAAGDVMEAGKNVSERTVTGFG